MRYFGWLITLPLAVLAVAFAISNRGAVPVGLWPLPFIVDAPVYLVVFIAVVVGFLAGGLVAWAAAGADRRMARRRADRVAELAAEVKRLKAQASERGGLPAERR